MAKRKATCERCSRERYEDRMVQGLMPVYVGRMGVETTRPIGYWECFGRASCRAAKKERNRAARKASGGRPNDE